MKNNLFPIFLKTEHLRFLIVGGGNVGLEKVLTLIKQNPSVNLKVIAKDFKQELIDILLNILQLNTKLMRSNRVIWSK